MEILLCLLDVKSIFLKNEGVFNYADLMLIHGFKFLYLVHNIFGTHLFPSKMQDIIISTIAHIDLRFLECSV